MSTELVVALVSAGVAVLGAGTSVWGQFRLAKMQEHLEEKREKRAKAEKIEEMLSKYREPLLSSAFELQSRIFNILRMGFLEAFRVNGSESEKSYAVDNTLFVLAQYLGWTEVMRREIQFLDLGDAENTRRFSALQDAICNVLLSSQTRAGFRLFRGEQRAIGELMATETKDGLRCLGYAAFVRNRDQGFTQWFEGLRRDIDRQAEDPSAGSERLIELQHALVDLLEFLDPEAKRFPKERRMKV